MIVQPDFISGTSKILSEALFLFTDLNYIHFYNGKKDIQGHSNLLIVVAKLSIMMTRFAFNRQP